jgi:hypothetical protein
MGAWEVDAEAVVRADAHCAAAPEGYLHDGGATHRSGSLGCDGPEASHGVGWRPMPVSGSGVPRGHECQTRDGDGDGDKDGAKGNPTSGRETPREGRAGGGGGGGAAEWDGTAGT